MNERQRGSRAVGFEQILPYIFVQQIHVDNEESPQFAAAQRQPALLHFYQDLHLLHQRLLVDLLQLPELLVERGEGAVL